ncbi:MAG: TusE/DsrC/DsvC family sulfur relay protein [Candidatus Eisenbacteria bacterium]|jgi:tRNA 2-thiouridine synthesizing protein E|nr:TusE/DsrC/DsvC family sulfur relay protein [Candidatus Eisenbacteria bacterium]
MGSIEISGHSVQLNEEGFLQNPGEWNRDVAAELARTQEGLDAMTDEHWSVVNYIRDYYLEHNLAPMVRKICMTTGLKLTRIFELFPSGPAKGACKVAGLPKPDGCV